MNKILSSEELAAVLTAGVAKIASDLSDGKKLLDYYALTREQLYKLVDKLDGSAHPYYLGAVNAGFILGFSNVVQEFPMRKLWDDLNSNPDIAALSDDTTKVGDAYRELRAFLMAANLIPSNEPKQDK
jgi:hypothetical protein